MAPFSNYISFLFLTTLLLPLQIIARDSQYFSKVPHFNNNNNVKETELANNEGPENKPEQQPVFIPETEKSYGLYGHESTEHPSTTTTTTNDDPYTTPTTYQPYKTEFQHTSKYPNKYYNYNNDAYNTDHNELSNTRLTGTGYSNNNNYYNKDAYDYEGNRNKLSDAKYTEGGYNSLGSQNNYKKYYSNNNAANDKYYYNNDNYNAATESDRYSYNNNAANNRYNGEKQGMSDTRFLEGGKYFYDVNYEKYNPTLYGESSRGVNTNNWYKKRGSHYGNHGGHDGNNNAYQNQEEFEDEQDDFEP